MSHWLALTEFLILLTKISSLLTEPEKFIYVRKLGIRKRSAQCADFYF